MKRAEEATTDVAAAERAILQRLEDCLAAVRISYDIGRRDLTATEGAIRRLERRSMAPSANEFWETTALPQAERFAAEARKVIERELDLLAGLGTDRVGVMATGDRLAAILPTTDGIDALGSWWQRRLRRSAMVRALPVVAANPPGEAGLLTAHHEMRLLDSPPWSHCDRLLSAFELAHREVVELGRTRTARLLAPADRARPRISAIVDPGHSETSPRMTGPSRIASP